MSYAAQKKDDGYAIASYLLDDVWPEYADYIGRECNKGDQLLAPGIGGHAFFRRYHWPLAVKHVGTMSTFARHFEMRRVAKYSGAERQRSYQLYDQAIADMLKRHIDYRAQHLVVYQNYLPWLAQSGALGGRSYDVLMTRYPLKMLHARLDEVSRHLPDCSTIRDYRADAALGEYEWQALSSARRIVTPHHGIAKAFGDRVHLLEWSQPPKSEFNTGDRVAFLGPVIARHGAYAVRDLARQLQKPLIVFSAQLEGDGFWQGITIERRIMSASWLNEVAVILQPSVAANQPRKLLEAFANGVQIYTNEGAGLPFEIYQPFEQFAEIKFNREKYFVAP